MLDCCICLREAKWFQMPRTVRSKGWYYCEDHAKLQSDFKQNNVYVTWTKIQRKAK